MRTRMQLTPKAAPTMKLKTVFTYTAASIVVFGALIWGVFLYLNIGNTETTFAASQNYSSKQSGNWTTSSTWTGGGAPPTTNIDDNIVINNNHNISLPSTMDLKNGASITVNTGGTLTIVGNIDAGNDLTLIVNGNLIVSGGIDIGNNANVTVNNNGRITASGAIDFGNNGRFIVNGQVNSGNNITFGNNSVFNGNGQISATGTGCTNWQGPGTCNDIVTLPVELLSFTASTLGNSVKLDWKTASELNNDHFTIERSANGTSYTTVATINGNGTTKSVSSYDYIDSDPLHGRSYYRLSQTDYDGTTEVFAPIAVEAANAPKESSFKVFPNPLRGSTLNVSFDKPEEGTIEILDTRGNKIAVQSMDGFTNQVQFQLSGNMQPGLYYVNYKTNSATETVKIVKQQ